MKLEENGFKNFLHIQKLQKLQFIFAFSNRINDFSDIERLSELIYLKEIDLTNNSIRKRPAYRISVLKKIPNLLYLDGKVRK